ncbi:MAG: general secretion pathway protein GspM [Burkholderiaceae bacterium]|nr:general secretion pathway protein GspM [Burkholderiaceae bacterium]
MNLVFRGRPFPLAALAWVLLIALSAFGLYYLKTKHDWATDRLQEIEQRHARLAGLEMSRAELDQAESAARAALSVGVYPASEDASRAGNDAQRRVRDAFSKAGLQVVSSQVLAAKVDRAFDRIPMAVRLEGDLVALQGALMEIPQLSPKVLLDGMTVQTIGAVKADAPQRLAIQLSLSVLRARQ